MKRGEGWTARVLGILALVLLGSFWLSWPDPAATPPGGAMARSTDRSAMPPTRETADASYPRRSDAAGIEDGTTDAGPTRAPRAEPSPGDPSPEDPAPAGVQVVPVTRAQRERFVELVLDPGRVHIVASHDHLLEKARRRIPQGLPESIRIEAESIVLQMVDADLVFRLEQNEVLKDYVLTAPDLARSAQSERGTGGVIEYGVSHDAIFGARATSVRIEYHLSYATHPRLGAAKQTREDLAMRLDEVLRR